MTARELREVLFNVNNQNMAVRELRNILFDIDNQDAKLTPEKLNEITMLILTEAEFEAYFSIH